MVTSPALRVGGLFLTIGALNDSLVRRMRVFWNLGFPVKGIPSRVA